MAAFPDRLADAVKRHGPLCVGLDPRVEMLPSAYSPLPAPSGERGIDPLLQFCLRVLELVRPFCGIVKPQAAFFELLGPPGFAALQALQRRAKEMGFVTILDAKRGDIASTAQAYADAAFGPVWDADALTVNPYLGRDSIEPFLSVARKAGPPRGLFVLVRTSNPGGGLFQNRLCDGQPLYRHVGEAVADWNDARIGACGLGDVGAVVGATHPAELAELRAALPKVWFLIPGYGAQGGTAADVRAGYRPDGLGAVVNSSRGVVFPFHPDDPDWEAKITESAKRAQAELKV